MLQEPVDKVSERRIEEMNSDSDQLAESYDNSQVSDEQNALEEESSEVVDIFNEPPPPAAAAETNEIQSSGEEMSNGEEDDYAIGEQNSEPDPSQLVLARSRSESSSSSSSNIGASGLIDDSEAVDAVDETNVNDLVGEQGKDDKITSATAKETTMDPMANSIRTAAGEAREQRANIRRAKKREGGEMSPKRGPKDSGTIGSIRTNVQHQPLTPALLTSSTTTNTDKTMNLELSSTSSSSPHRPERRRNKDEKAGWRDDDYVLGLDSSSDLSSKFQQQQQQQQPGAVRILTTTTHVSSAFSESDSKPFSLKLSQDEESPSSSLSKQLAGSSDRFVSAAVIDEEALQREFENKIKADMVSAEQVEVYKEPRFCQTNTFKISCCTFVILVGLVIGLVVGMGQTSQVTNITTNAPTMSPTLLDDDQYLKVLFTSISGGSEVFRDVNSPQSMALETISRENKEGIFNVRNVSEQYLAERYALRVLYYSTNGDEWLIADHNFVDSTLNTCAWMNVTQGNRLLCNDLGEVTDLFLNVAGLKGTIPAELGVLTSLSQLSLAKNSLYGSIPSSLGDLKDMKFMQFALNQLSGSIPSTFERFTKLERFIMHVNKLTGTLPNLWGDEFRRLRINDNKLTGSIPDMPTQMPFDWFQISDNAFTGTLPKNLAAQPKLITLAISNNRFEGTIPEQCSALTLMENFVVDGNLLQGTLPSMLGRLTEIDWFWVNDNNFSGSLPTSFQAMAKATQFKFQNNNFTGTLPNDWSSLENLVSLDVSSNQNLMGTVPASYIGLEALTSFALSGTRISGGLTDTFCVTQQLDSLSAECGGETPFIDCPCCSICCDQDYCAVQNLDETCSSRSGTLQNFDQFRDATCSCSNDSTQVACTESCESCNVDGSSCVQSIGYGHNLNPIDGERIDFFNTFEYTTGPYEGTVISFQESVIDELTDECEVTVNGEKCRACKRQVCKSDLVGLTIVCDNLSTPAEIKTCDDQSTDESSSYLDFFVYWDPARVSGCNLLLYRVNQDSN